MAKDKSGKSEVTRVDLRIPNHLFEEIEKLAIETNQPLHHRTGKIITTPVILNLIQLGLKSVRQDNVEVQAIASKDSLKEAEIEKKILSTLLQKVEGILSDKLADIVKDEVNEAILRQFNETQTNLELMVKNEVNQVISTQFNETQANLDEMVTSKINEVMSTLKDNQEDKSEIVEPISDRESDNNFTEEIKEIFSLDEFEDSEDKEITDNFNLSGKVKDKITDKKLTKPKNQLETETADNLNIESNLDISDKVKDKITDKKLTKPKDKLESEVTDNSESQIKLNLDTEEINQEAESAITNTSLTFEDSVEEIKRLRKSLGENYAKIAKRLTEGNYPTKQGKYKWSGTQVKRILEKS